MGYDRARSARGRPVTGFAADWLALRAEADDRARAPGLVARLTDWVGDRAIAVADLGGGSGATRRALAPHLPTAHWRILDDDPALLALVGPGAAARQVDLAADPEAAFADAPDLITASAFFDLTSRAWIDRFVDLLAAHRLPLYASLTYDGREVWAPAPPHEKAALAAFHADMARDKGFGPALGPAAAERLESSLAAAGFDVHSAQSDWRLTRPRDAALIDALATGGAAALKDVLAKDAHGPWAAGRKAADEVLVGHRDMLAFPP